MKTIAIAVSASLLLLTSPVFAAGSNSAYSNAKPVDSNFTQGMAAIKAKDWNQVITSMKKVVEKDENNANAWNHIGHAYRQIGDMENSFKHYERALTIDPKHKGAHEYIGEAYLVVKKLDKAEEHLAILKKLCTFRCEEYTELKDKIAAYKQSNPTS